MIQDFSSAEVMSINLSKEEFASALGMKPSEMFVRYNKQIVYSLFIILFLTDQELEIFIFRSRYFHSF